MKKCLYCAEEIQDDAIKCRFCGEFLKKKKKWQGCLTGCLVSMVVSFTVIILFIFISTLILKIILYKIFMGLQYFPPYHYLPFMGQGIEGILREFAEVFKALWEKLRDFLHFGVQIHRITF